MDSEKEALAVAELQRRWILEGWEKSPGERFVFKDKAGQFYDWASKDVALFDSFDPELRLARSPGEWAEAFEASFNRMHSALHAVIAEPDVLVCGDIAASAFGFCARLQRGHGMASGVLCRTSHVFTRSSGDWKIVREHTSGRTITAAEAEELLARHKPQKLESLETGK
ncbi:SnoaL-like domain-containing protein [Devosia crocina]|uniref:SnoaL-like domain-containing protein n=1 Tax=Devosia crocina TaxID=429728 RepID=A0A1I7N889_9HYPH|nr:nuclear transport factor 2 family protein [Devosia crocina]SFV30865.1 SnoaL-like domain-containing protein [Devosia crocina]